MAPGSWIFLRGGRVGICTVLVFCGVFSTRFGFRAGFVGAGILLIIFPNMV